MRVRIHLIDRLVIETEGGRSLLKEGGILIKWRVEWALLSDANASVEILQ